VTEALRKKANVVATSAGFTVTPVDGFTGILVVPIVATVDGVQTVVYNRVVVSPEAPAPKSFAPVTIGRSAIAWSSTPSQVVSYEVAVNNKVVCTTTTTTCSVPALIGPNSKVTLVAVGNDATVSTAQVVPYVAKAPIPALKVNFATGSAVLTAEQKAEITAIAKVIKSEGFTRLVVNGFTDSRGSAALNAALSKARASAVVAYMQKLLPTVAVKAGAKGSANPVASNANPDGQAANRRTEIATW
jgi:outer membrane protein OmpA-like peptidoglycan-associated protein